MHKIPLLISNPINIFYLTKLNIFLNTYRDAYVLLINEKIYLLTNKLYLEEVKKYQVSRVTYHVIEISGKKTLAKNILKILKKYQINRLRFESNDLTVSEYKLLKKQLIGIRLNSSIKEIEKLRILKTAEEIVNLQTAAYHTDKCFKYIIKQLKTKVTETEIAWKIENFFKEKYVDLAFPPVVAFGSNTSQPHHAPANTKLKSKDIVLLDFGAKVNGYCSDMTRTIFIGKPTVEQNKAYLTLLKVYETVAKHYNLSINCSELNKRINGADLDKMAKKMIKQSKFPPYEHGLGHGVGLNIHEAPRLSIKKPEILKPGMVFTLEPAIYLPGKFGIRLENTVLMTNQGIEPLTNSSLNLTILH